MHGDNKRHAVYQAEAKRHVKEGGRSRSAPHLPPPPPPPPPSARSPDLRSIPSASRAPLEALPGNIVFFFRTVEMLQGLCTLLGVATPFMRPMARHAQRHLLELARAEAGADPADASSPSSSPPPFVARDSAATASSLSSSSLFHSREKATAAGSGAPPRGLLGASAHERVLRLMAALSDTGQLLGAQCATAAPPPHPPHLHLHPHLHIRHICIYIYIHISVHSRHTSPVSLCASPPHLAPVSPGAPSSCAARASSTRRAAASVRSILRP